MENFSKTFAVLLICWINLTLGKHLSSYNLGDVSNDVVGQNEKFYNDVRNILKRKLNENSNIIKKQLSMSLLERSVKRNLQMEGNEELLHKVRLPTSASVPTPVLVENWPTAVNNFGQVTAVAIDPEGNPVIFHRADRYWNANTFNESNIYHLIENGPIKDKTIHILDSKTGAVKSSWGEDMFYMPHGMTIDRHGNYWITDVAMHQAFKIKPYDSEPLLAIGKRFRPGSSLKHLCKPTSIAVATTGEFFIADGYCNQRILKFNAAGYLLRTIPQPPEFLSLQVPHAVTLLEDLDLLCIADRENMRVVCPRAGLKSSKGEGKPAATIQEPDLGRVFGVTAYQNIVFAVNGPTSTLPVRGFSIDPRSETIIGHWGEFENPHSIAVCLNDSSLYITEIGRNQQTNRIWKYVIV